MTMRVTFPRRFVNDCLDCDCDVGVPARWTKGKITLEMNPKQAAELKSRAEYYAGSDGPDGPDLLGLKLSARRTLELIDAALAEADRLARLFWSTLDGGVADLEDAAVILPRQRVTRRFTTMDTVTVINRPDHSPPFEYQHNGVRVERERAFDLIGERR